MEEKKEVVTGFPPMHALATWGAMVACFVSTLPSLETIDQVAKPQSFTHVVFPEFLSTNMLGYIRLAIATLMLLKTIRDQMYTVTVHITTYSAGSKLLTVPFTIAGFKNHYYFTNWTWNLLNLSFFLNGYLALYSDEKNEWLMRIAIVTFASSAPSNMLVSSIIKYVIWDQIRKQGGNTKNLQRSSTLIHHTINSILAISEVALLGGIPVRMQEFSVAPLYGLVYILFAWMTRHSYTEAKHGPQFLYFFFDTTLPGYTTSVSMICLLFVFILFYVSFCLMNLVLQDWWILGNGLGSHLVFVVLCSTLLCRFRD